MFWGLRQHLETNNEELEKHPSNLTTHLLEVST